MDPVSRTILVRRKARRLIIAVTIFLVIVAVASVLQYSSMGSTEGRIALRHALNTEVLPSSIKIRDSEIETWIDYKFEAVCSINPKQFDELLAGRPFEKVEPSGVTQGTLSPGFEIAEEWEWEQKTIRCTVYSNQKRNRVLVEYWAN